MKDKNKPNPDGWQCYILGQYYKVGRFNKPYVYHSSGWVLTRSITVKTIQRHIKIKNSPSLSKEEKRKYVNVTRMDL